VSGRSRAATGDILARSHRTRFIHDQRAPHQILAVARFGGALCGSIIVDFDKPKPASLAGKTVAHDGHGIDCYAVIGKEILDIRLICGVREIPYEKLFH
jgi:hypothetical protein